MSRLLCRFGWHSWRHSHYCIAGYSTYEYVICRRPFCDTGHLRKIATHTED